MLSRHTDDGKAPGALRALAIGLLLLTLGVVLSLRTVPAFAGDGPSPVYNGAYVPLTGVTMSQAYASTIDVDFSTRHDHLGAGIAIGMIGLLLTGAGSARLRHRRPPPAE